MDIIIIKGNEKKNMHLMTTIFWVLIRHNPYSRGKAIIIFIYKKDQIV